jgi:hypothetical protein
LKEIKNSNIAGVYYLEYLLATTNEDRLEALKKERDILQNIYGEDTKA